MAGRRSGLQHQQLPVSPLRTPVGSAHALAVLESELAHFQEIQSEQIFDWQTFYGVHLKLIRQLQTRLDRKDVENEKLKERLDILERRLERSERRRGHVTPSCTEELTALTHGLAHQKSNHQQRTAQQDQEKRSGPTLRKRKSDPDVQQKQLKKSAASVEHKHPVAATRKHLNRNRLLVESDELVLSRLDDVPPQVGVPGFRTTNKNSMSKSNKRSRTDREDVSDDAFQRRHQKHEKFERQIVRRDKQRQRDLMLHEQLMKSQEARTARQNNNESDEMKHTRKLDDLQEIHIYKHLPKDVFVVSPRK